jgi:Domain of unknown function (DUF4406)
VTSLALYLAGPMRGLPEFNFPTFLLVGATLRQAGFTVFDPAEYDVSNGFDYHGLTGNEDLSELGFDLRDALATDLEFIARKADGVAVLPGWEQSKGARAEVATALALSLPVASASAWLGSEVAVALSGYAIKQRMGVAA